MEKLKIEEKAKRYDEILVKLQKAKVDNNVCDERYCCVIDDIVPELKEDKDEVIKKKLKHFLEVKRCCTNNDEEYRDCNQFLAWLEKQGEKFIPEDVNEAALQYVDNCSVDGEVKHDNIIEPYWNNHSMMNAYKAGWLKKQDNVNGLIQWHDVSEEPEEMRELLCECSVSYSSPWHEVVVYRSSNKTFWNGDQQVAEVTKWCYIDDIEKQAEQELGDTPKFHKGEWIACEELNTARILNIVDDRYEVEFIDGNKGFPHIDYIDKNFHLWNIRDAKDGDVLICRGEYSHGKYGEEIGIVKEYVGKYGGCEQCFKTYCLVDWDGIFRTDEYMGSNEIYPATKEQRVALERELNKEGYEWDADKKVLNKIEQKKPINKVKPKFNIGDTMRTLNEASNGITNGLPVVVSIDDKYYHCTNELIAIQDQDDYEYPAMNRRQNPAWGEEDKVGFDDAMWAIEQARTIAKDENDMGNLWYAEHWLKSLKDRVQLQPKQEWGEEDEEMFNAIIADIQFTLKAHIYEVDQVVYEREIDWLKSLKDRHLEAK